MTSEIFGWCDDVMKNPLPTSYLFTVLYINLQNCIYI